MLTPELLLLPLFDFMETDKHFKTLENLIFKTVLLSENFNYPIIRNIFKQY